MQRWRTLAVALAATLLISSGAMAQRRGGGFGRGVGAQMLRTPEVQTELKLSDEQKTKVTDLLQKLREEQREQFQGLRDLSPEERQKKVAEISANTDKQVATILNVDQMKRYRQLKLQQVGLIALNEKTVADEMKLTDEQRTKIATIAEAQAEDRRAAFQRGGDDVDPAERRAKMAAMRKATEDKIMAVLTETQKTSWKEMVGAPFTFPAPNRVAA